MTAKNVLAVALLSAALPAQAKAADWILIDGFESYIAPPAVALSFFELSPLEPGDAVLLQWTSSNATRCEATSSGPAATTWIGVRPTTSDASSEFVVLSVAGEYELTLRCFQGSLPPVVASVSIVPIERACMNSTDSGAAGFGFTRMEVPWEQIFAESPSGYPDGGPISAPVFMRRMTYVTVPFIAPSNMTVNLTFELADHPVPEFDYLSPNPATSTFVSISPCPGDLRRESAGAFDPFERPACRRFAAGATILHSTQPSPGPNVCVLVAGATYYLNLAPVNPAIPSASTCAPGQERCEVLATYRPVTQ